MIDPGTLPRGASLRAAARPAVILALGTAPWLVVAGLTEGFVTPRGLPLAAALAVGLFLVLSVLGTGGDAGSQSRAGLGFQVGAQAPVGKLARRGLDDRRPRPG